jgi:hypothetical protein
MHAYGDSKKLQKKSHAKTLRGGVHRLVHSMVLSIHILQIHQERCIPCPRFLAIASLLPIIYIVELKRYKIDKYLGSDLFHSLLSCFDKKKY